MLQSAGKPENQQHQQHETEDAGPVRADPFRSGMCHGVHPRPAERHRCAHRPGRPAAGRVKKGSTAGAATGARLKRQTLIHPATRTASRVLYQAVPKRV